MTDKKKITIFGVEQPLEKVYRTCTFQNLGSRKEEFLERIAQLMNARGFKKTKPIEPLELSLGTKTLQRFWDFSWISKFTLSQIAESDLLLIGEEKKGIKYKYPPMMPVRAKEKGEDLQLGYTYLKEVYDPKSAKGILGLLVLFTEIALAFIGSFLIGILLEPLGFWVIVFVVFITIFPFLAITSMYPKFIKPWLIEKEIGRRIVEIAESMGGKQITPFKRTTTELEE